MMMLTKVTGRLIAWLCVLSYAVVGFVAPAQAHDRLVQATPASGAKLSEVPTSGTWKFSANLIPKGAAVTVAGPDGAQVAVTNVQVVGDSLTADLAPVTVAGDYAVTWRVVSSDGHPISGKYTYSVLPAALAAASPTATTSSATPTDSAASASVSATSAAVTAAAEAQKSVEATESAAEESSPNTWWKAAFVGGLTAALVSGWLALRKKRTA